MPAKRTTPDQHQLLHQHWLTDCCLCAKEAEVAQLKQEIEDLRQELIKIKEKVEFWLGAI